jgi:hypothetical protein
MVVTISMGREGFDLERFPGRRRSATSPDNLNVHTGAGPESPRVPSLKGVPLEGPEFLEFSLPAAAMAAVQEPFPVRDNRNVQTLERGAFAASNLGELVGQTAVRGSGGGYLSNEISYRALLVNERLSDPDRKTRMGHIHTPRLAGFDPLLEAEIVAQIESMLIAAVEALP